MQHNVLIEIYFCFVSKTPPYLLEKFKPNEVTKNENPNTHWPSIVKLVWKSFNFENHTEMLHHTKVISNKEKEQKQKFFWN